MVQVQVEIDYKEYERQLKDCKDKMPKIARRLVGKVNAKVKTEARKTMRQRGFSKEKEDGIYKNLFSYANTDFTAKIGIKKKAFYARFVEKGARITARNGYLTFKVNEKFVKVKSVTLPAKPFLEPAVLHYWNTGKADAIMDAAFQKELDKLFKD